MRMESCETSFSGNWKQAPREHSPARPIHCERLLILFVLVVAACSSGCTGLTSAGSKAESLVQLILSNIGTSSLTTTAATITWTTNVAGSSQVLYGTTSSYGQSTSLNSTMATSHSASLSTLTASTLYHYQVVSVDASGNVAQSGDLTLTTPAASTPPTVSVTAPAAGATVSGSTVSVSANASASAGLTLTSVQFLLDGSNLGSPILAAPWNTSWNTTAVSNGTHSLTALATDSAGNKTTSAAVSVTVNNPIPPTISITSPASGATVSATVTVTTSVSANTTSVQFKVDGNNTGAAVTTAPFSYSLNTTTLTNATHSITAIASNAAAQSTTSAAVSITVNNAAPTPPTISITSPASGATVSATVTVTTSVSANTTSVQFKVDGNNTGAAVTTAPFSYSLNTTTLTNATHSITAIASNAAAQTTTSAAVSITVANLAPPVISNVSVSNVTSSTASISWTTDQPSSSQVDYGTTTNYGSSTPLNPTLVTSHSASLTALTPSTTYHFIVLSQDSNPTVSASSDATFTTLIDAPPVISGVSSSPSSSSMVVSWTTDKPATSQVNYGTSTSYGLSTPLDSTLVTSHSVTMSGLAPSTTYDFRLDSTDSLGTLAQSGNLTATTLVQTTGIPSSLGWYDIPNSTLQSVCPPNTSTYAFSDLCNGVVDGWSGAVADSKRNRLIIWGGGHTNYAGNEVYALDLNALQMIRLNNPSPVNTTTACVETLSDGTPNSRHTYDSLTYIPSADVMFSFGGSLNDCGYFSSATWTLSLSTLQWTSQDPHNGPTPGAYPGVVADYDPNTQLVFLSDTHSLFSYSYSTNTYVTLNNDTALDYHMTGVIDPVRKLFIVFGGGWSSQGGLAIFSIASGSSYAMQNLTSQTTGCDALLNASSPGLAYDSVQQLIVGWPDFGNTVYQFDPDTLTCTAVTYPDGPPDSSQDGSASTSNGTFGRFRYFPSLGVFGLVNESSIDGHTIRLTPTP